MTGRCFRLALLAVACFAGMGCAAIRAAGRREGDRFRMSSSDRIVSVSQGWGELGLNTSAAAVGQQPLKFRIKDKQYAHGLGHHANGEITVDLGGQFKTFHTEIGIQWQGGQTPASVVFQIFIWHQVACGQFFTVGLKSDGTVVAAGVNNFGQCDVASWANIVQVAALGNLVLGLKSNGTVVATGFNNYGQCNVSGWTGIVQIAAEGSTAVGLKYDGTVVATGNNSSGQCNVSSWTGIKQITGAGGFTIGLKSDGTVIAAGSDTYGQCDLSSWSAITQVATGSFNTIGLKSDGTVVAAGPLSGTLNYGQCDVASWKGIIQIGTGYYSTMGLKSDGTVVATGRNDVNYNESTNANSWNLGCRTLTSIQGGGAFVTQNNGIITSITGANNQVIVSIGSINNGNTPPSVGTVSLNGSQYYDTNVTSNSNLGTGATATITISNSSITANSTIEYWYNNNGIPQPIWLSIFCHHLQQFRETFWFHILPGHPSQLVFLH